ncbi:MAG TPA: ABC transporter substrate-binding protein [Bacillota bacterium]|nr:ABC transporter substrate-binding protein [Bacillota bacterium]
MIDLSGKKHIFHPRTLWGTLLFFLLCGLIVLPLSGCAKKDSGKEIGIAEQYGIAYAPLQIMREQKLLEKELPGIKINWKQYGGPTPIREAMLAGEVDFGFMGSAPVLIGLDNGMEWKYATGISSNEVALVTNRPEVNSLRDFSDTDRIAVLSPGSTQHVLLCIASDREFGDPNHFDNQIVSLSHPDAMDALIAGTEITAHFSTPPYIDEELSHGMKIVTTGEEIMGQPFTFITGVATVEFHDGHPEEYAAILRALNTATDYINNNMDEAVATLAPVYGVDEATLKKQMTYNGTIYSTRLTGIDKLAEEMYRIGMLKKPIRYEDAVFPEPQGSK